MAEYKVGGEISSQHPRPANAMSSTSQLPKTEMLYRYDGTARAREGARQKPEQKNSY